MITAIVLAAGLSSRMGQTKPLLPWGQQTIIEHILSVLRDCAIEEMLVVTGHEREAVERRLAEWSVRAVFNPHYATGEMLASIRVGLLSAAVEAEAALMVLGDQPALETSVIDKIVAAYRNGQRHIVAPSYQMRRGHPLLISRKYWRDILALGEGQTLRDFLRRNGEAIHYVEVTTPSVLQDMDTPDDYRRELEGFLSAHPTPSSREAQEV